MRHDANSVAKPRMNTLYCPRCKFGVVVPSSMTADIQSVIAGQVRCGEKLEAMRAMREYQSDLTQVKAIANHVTKTGAGCVRCDHVFSEPGNHYCPKCKALNFNW